MIVSNATPFIALARIGCLELFERVIGDVVIPEAVARELSEYSPARPGAIDVSQEHWIRVLPIKSEQQVRLLLPTLDRGEAEVIALALEHRARLVVMDELTGRKVAESMNLNVSGTVGILIRAKQTGAISSVKPLLDEMKKQGVYFSERFIEAVLKQIGE